jgi:sialate O-acetylesterase
MQRRTLDILVVVFGWVCLQGGQVQADVKLPSLIGDGMVLQQGMKVPLWGTADPDEKVTVQFQDQKVAATARDGKWSVVFDKLKAGGPFEMTITGKNTIRVKNVLVGEVWICSGQSNMEMKVVNSANAREVIANATNPMIRLFTVKRIKADKPLSDVTGNWSECTPQTLPGFSAVGYFFGRDLEKALGVPVGLIHTSWGGTPAEFWTSRAVLDAYPELKGLNGSQLYNGMIAPLIPYAIRGATWYQGESNAKGAYQYRTLFPAMIKNWRDDWKQGDFPFLFVQLAPYKKIEKEPQESDWAELREAQLLTSLKVPNTAMAVITDVGDEKDIHPKRKEPVGARLALAALGLAYGKEVVYSGPLYDNMHVEGNKAVLAFTHIYGGLVAKDGPLTGFTIAGEDKKFVNAEAEIRNNAVVVWSARVDKPIAVRYGWANYPTGNLWNRDGLPASPFRTDDFPMITRKEPPAKKPK